MRASRRRLVTAVAVAALVFGSSLAAIPLGTGTHPATPKVASSASQAAPAAVSPAASTDGSAAAAYLSMQTDLHARGVPSQDIHPPRLERGTPGSRQVGPTYTTGPAPMGLSDLGLRNVSGTIVPYDLNTTSVWGSLTLTKAVAAYIDGDGPDTFGVQLNAVATNVTLFGTPGYQFWTQDYVSYTPSTGNLTLGDNVWNFSNESAGFPSNILSSYGPGGHPEAPYYYYAVGPSYTIHYPFTLNLFLNATDIGGRPAVYFNYSISQGGVPIAEHGSLDYVVFNSARGHVTHPAPVPAFQVNGTGIGPSGLPNDLELDLVGNDDGDTTTFYAISGTASLSYWNATAGTYREVPSAFDAGSDTGETSNGILPVENLTAPGGAPYALLETGPSFVQGLWNVSGALNGAREIRVTLHPENSFLFVSPGLTFNASAAQWVPTIRFGTATSDLWIPNVGYYTFDFLLSDRTVSTFQANASGPAPNSTTAITITLAVSAAAGSYTPLLAFGNAELKAISQHGNGTLLSPWVLIHHPNGPLNPVFGQLNDYGFPVFSAVMLVDTSAPVRVLDPSAGIAYGAWELPTLDFFGLPLTNQLQLEFWNVTNVTVDNSTDLGGWLTAQFAFFPVGTIVFWDSSGNLVANNTFYDQGASIALYGGTNNTIWGNRFLASAVSSALYEGENTTGILEDESGDLVYNNYFAVGQPAITGRVDPYSCQEYCVPVQYVDRWNVPLEPANASQVVLGSVLTGSILRTWYQGGNYWSNYGNATNPLGVLPYNDSGLIEVGGDYVPLYPSAIYPITFIAVGIVPGSEWNVTLGGLTLASTNLTVTFWVVNGSYPYTVNAGTGYLAPPGGLVDIFGAGNLTGLVFAELFRVTVTETGLAGGWPWSVTFNTTYPSGTNRTLTSSGTTATGYLANATYTISPSSHGYSVDPRQVTVDGRAVTTSLTFTPNASSGWSGWELAFVGALAAAVVGFVLAAVLFVRRPKPPAPIVPASIAAAPAAAAAPAPPAGPAPWEEGSADAENPPTYTPQR